MTAVLLPWLQAARAQSLLGYLLLWAVIFTPLLTYNAGTVEGAEEASVCKRAHFQLLCFSFHLCACFTHFYVFILFKCLHCIYLTILMQIWQINAILHRNEWKPMVVCYSRKGTIKLYSLVLFHVLLFVPMLMSVIFCIKQVKSSPSPIYFCFYPLF